MRIVCRNGCMVQHGDDVFRSECNRREGAHENMLRRCVLASWRLSSTRSGVKHHDGHETVVESSGVVVAGQE